MPSPFPGMDPYLEDPVIWRGVHQSLNTYIRDALQPMLRPKYHARLDERVYLAPLPQIMYPDVSISRIPKLREPATSYNPSVAIRQHPVIEPFTLVLLGDDRERRKPFIEIIQSKTGEVVTVIELISPSNKMGAGHEEYARKQEEILNTRANLVEIDLLGNGIRVTPEPEDINGRIDYRYMVSVNRSTRRNAYELYPIRLTDSLPHFRVPLVSPDPDVTLDLQTVFDLCYDNGDYASVTDYNQPPSVRMSFEEGAWVKQRLTEYLGQ